MANAMGKRVTRSANGPIESQRFQAGRKKAAEKDEKQVSSQRSYHPIPVG
jgi:hypothetical protein